MARGKAVITSSVAALTEIVQDEVTGLVFEKGNAESLAATIERYIESPQLRTEMGARAREWVLAERDWNNVVEIVDATYRELLGGDGQVDRQDEARHGRGNRKSVG